MIWVQQVYRELVEENEVSEVNDLEKKIEIVHLLNELSNIQDAVSFVQKLHKAAKEEFSL